MNDFITTAQAAEILGLEPGTLKTWRRLKKGPKYKRLQYGRARVVYSKEVIEKFKEEQMHV